MPVYPNKKGVRKDSDGSDMPPKEHTETKGAMNMCMTDKKEGILVYDPKQDRYGFYSTGDVQNTVQFHCGSTMEVFLNQKWEVTRLEHNGKQWYLEGTGLTGEKLENRKIRVKSINGVVIPY